MPEQAVILAQVEILSKVYQRQIPQAELEAIAHVWAHDLSGMENDDFSNAVQEHRKTSRYWPSPADILQAMKRVTAARANPHVHESATRDEPSSEQLLRSRISLCLIEKTLDGDTDPRVNEFFWLREDWTRKYALAQEIIGDDYEQICRGRGDGASQLQPGKWIVGG